MAKKQDQGWHEWNGNKCPVPAGTLVEVEYRDGEFQIGHAQQLVAGEARCPAYAYWVNEGSEADIVRYRVIDHAS